MATVPLTSAAQRALDSARQIAANEQAPEALPIHLLKGLATTDGIASELLHRCGLNAIEVLGHDPSAMSSEIETRPPLSDELTDVMAEACRITRKFSASGEVSSEHLLWSLARSQSDASRWMSDQGLNEAWLKAEIAENAETEGPPIEVSFSFDEPSRDSHQPKDIGPRSASLPKPHFEDRPISTRLIPPPAPDDASQSATSGERQVWRLLDAVANRANEGLRVIEDYVRFLTDDARLSRRLKVLRHELGFAVGKLDTNRMLESRDAANDVGSSISTESESRRADPEHVARANIKRVQESLRSLEEFSKLVNVDAATAFEHLRYRMYDVEKDLMTPDSRFRQLHGARLYLLVCHENCQLPLERVVKEACQNGVDVIQLREKNRSDYEIAYLAEHVREWTHSAGKLLIINDRAEVARTCGADGVHLGQEDQSPAEARALLGKNSLIGLSTHSLSQARDGETAPVDYLGVGPTFRSQTKHFESFAGLEFVRQVSDSIQKPWFAIGGISSENIETVISAGATRVAVSAAICRSEHPGLAARQLSHSLAQS